MEKNLHLTFLNRYTHPRSPVRHCFGLVENNLAIWKTQTLAIFGIVAMFWIVPPPPRPPGAMPVGDEYLKCDVCVFRL